MWGVMNGTCANADDFHTAVADTRFERIALGPNVTPARVTSARLGTIGLLRVEQDGLCLEIVRLPPDRVLIVFPTRWAAAQLWQGIALRPGDLLLVPPGARLRHVMRRAGGWGWVALHQGALLEWYETLAGEGLAMPASETVLRPARAAGTAFARIHEEVTSLAASASTLLDDPEIARAMEQELIEALVACLRGAAGMREAPRRTAARLRHSAMLSRFEDSLADQFDRPVSLEARAKEIGIPVRTLRAICMRLVGMGPHAYSTALRLHAVRAVLCDADPETASVAKLARALGFREAGRFSARYRRVFGESPSATLRRRGAGRTE